jgi:hypothetical protein
MKKLLLSFIVCLVTFITCAQNHEVVDLLNVRALQTGTNGWGVTNLSCLFTNTGMIYNPTNVSYTNLSGSHVGTSTAYLASKGTTNAFTTVSLFKDLPLHVDRDGRPIFTFIATDATTPPTTNSAQLLSPTTLMIEYVNPYGSNAPFGLTFRPVYDGATAAPQTGEDWGVRIAGLSTTKGLVLTNIPTWRWPGAVALRVVAVTNQFVLAGIAEQTNSTYITKLRAVTFRP